MLFGEKLQTSLTPAAREALKLFSDRWAAESLPEPVLLAAGCALPEPPLEPLEPLPDPLEPLPEPLDPLPEPLPEPLPDPLPEPLAEVIAQLKLAGV